MYLDRCTCLLSEFYSNPLACCAPFCSFQLRHFKISLNLTVITLTALYLCNLSIWEVTAGTVCLSWSSALTESLFWGLASQFMRPALESVDGQRTILYCFLVTSLIVLCVLIHAVPFVIDCLHSRSSNKRLNNLNS